MRFLGGTFFLLLANCLAVNISKEFIHFEIILFNLIYKLFSCQLRIAVLTFREMLISKAVNIYNLLLYENLWCLFVDFKFTNKNQWLFICLRHIHVYK